LALEPVPRRSVSGLAQEPHGQAQARQPSVWVQVPPLHGLVSEQLVVAQPALAQA
jgi:hypothetical protein